MSGAELKRTIALVEDDPLVAEHLVEALNGHDDFHVAAHAASIEAARTMIGPHIELVLLDIGLPDGSGLDLVSEIKRDSGARVLILTSFGDRETVIAALTLGARIEISGGTPGGSVILDLPSSNEESDQ